LAELRKYFSMGYGLNIPVPGQSLEVLIRTDQSCKTSSFAGIEVTNIGIKESI